MGLDLTGREWPVREWDNPRYRDQPAAGEVRATYFEPYVSEGYAVCRRLGIWGVQRGIPDGESGVTSLAVGNGCAFGATSGRRAHLFGYFIQPHFECIFPMAVFEEDTAIRHALAWVEGRGLYGGTAGPGLRDYAGGRLFRVAGIRYPADVIQEWAHRHSDVEFLGSPVPGEGIACLIHEPVWNRLYGLSDRTGMLFHYGIESGETVCVGPWDPIGHFSRDLFSDAAGRVWGATAAGRFGRYDPATDRLERLNLRVPAFPGRSQYTRVEAWAVDGRSGRVYGGDVADGLLFELDPAEERVRVLGKPTAQAHIRCLGVVPDGRVYGVAGPPGGLGHLFVYEPGQHALRDLGILTASLEERSYGYEFDAMTVTPEGRVLLGENERIGRVFSYFPPLPAPPDGGS